MELNIKDEDFAIQAEGSSEFISSIAQTTFYFKGVSDWKENNIPKLEPIHNMPIELKKTLEKSPKNNKKKDITEKLCHKCNQTKPVSDFYKHNSDKSGYQPYCKECAKTATKQYIEKKKQIETKPKIKEGEDPLELNKLINWYNGKTVFDLRDFLNNHKEITTETADKMVSRLITKNKIIQISGTTFKVV